MKIGRSIQLSCLRATLSPDFSRFDSILFAPMTAPSFDDDPNVDSEREDAGSLYDPPDGEGEEYAADQKGDCEQLRIEIPRELARRLLRVSMHLGLSPSLVASRAIDLVWDEIGTVSREEHLSTQTLIQRYQARVDILQILESGLQDGAAGHGTKSESSRSWSAAPAGEDEASGSKNAHLWDAVDKVQDVLDEEEIEEGSIEEPDGESSNDKLRRPEKEDHSWDEVDEIIETGEDSRTG